MPRFKLCLQAFILNEKWVKHILNIVYLLLIFFLKCSKHRLNSSNHHGYLSRQIIRPTTLKINPETPEGKFRCKSRKQIFHSFTLKVSFGTFHHQKAEEKADETNHLGPAEFEVICNIQVTYWHTSVSVVRKQLFLIKQLDLSSTKSKVHQA